MTKIPNSKPVLVIETGDPPAGWGVRRTNIGIWDLFGIWCLGFGISEKDQVARTNKKGSAIVAAAFSFASLRSFNANSSASFHLLALSLANSSGLIVQKGVPSFVNRTLYS